MTIVVGNALSLPWASESVQVVVTSPPYYGLRDYGTAQWEGGDPTCEHKSPPNGGRGASTMNSGESHERWIAKLDGTLNYRTVCGKCGARRIDSQLGLESTVEEYVANMVAVFREVRRVLRKDGCVFLNLGDSYAGNPGNGRGGESPDGGVPHRSGMEKVGNGLKPKDLIGIPWRVAFALQADGWWLRSEIIWHKPNPMPESVTDRPTKAHEQVFLLAKSARYYYDAEAIKEERQSDHERPSFRGGAYINNSTFDNQNGGKSTDGRDIKSSLTNRNRRSVWTVATQSFPDAHFATFPEKLVEPCILAGTSAKGCCPTCGSPWERVVERGLTAHDGSTESQYEKGTTANRLAKLRQAARERGEE